MKKAALSTLIALVLMGTVGSAFAADNDSHTVTVTVSAINELAIAGGNVSLTINAATPGSEPDAATDTSTSLAWTTNEAARKITVASDLAAPTFTLKAQATSVSGSGSAAAQLTVTNVAQDFVTAIATEVGGCTLSYEASATAAQGTGSDAHTITYTLTSS